MIRMGSLAHLMGQMVIQGIQGIQGIHGIHGIQWSLLNAWMPWMPRVKFFTLFFSILPKLKK